MRSAQVVFGFVVIFSLISSLSLAGEKEFLEPVMDNWQMRGLLSKSASALNGLIDPTR